MIKDKECPCRSGAPFVTCCQPVLHDHRQATTAAMLMRSRYTAFVLRNAEYIQASWHRKTRPNTLDFDNHPVVWLGLEIHGCQDGSVADDSGTVDFTCSYLENGQLCKLKEVSEFLREDGLWYYLRGECRVAQEKIARNSPCPCGSGQKFKRCCLARS